MKIVGCLATFLALAISSSRSIAATAPLECLDYGDFLRVVAYEMVDTRFCGACINGDVAYLFSPADGLQVFDFADPAVPRLLGSQDLPGEVTGSLVAGRYLYAAAGTVGIIVYDVVQPSHPVFLGIVDTAGEATAMARRGEFLYVADGSAGLKVFQLARRGLPRVRGGCDTPGRALAVDLLGDMAYVADEGGGVQVLDVSDRNAPSIVGAVILPGAATAVAHSGASLYVGSGDNVLKVFDVTDPVSPAALATFDVDYPPRELTVRNGHLYMLTEQTMSVYRISDTQQPVRVGFTWFGSGRVMAFGDESLLVPTLGGFRVVAIANPASAPSVGQAVFRDYQGPANGLSISGHFLYAARNTSGVQIYDIGDPGTVTLAGAIPVPDYSRKAVVVGDYAYIANGPSGLLIYDVSQAPASVAVAAVATTGWTYDVWITPGLAHLAVGDSGYWIVDIADPAHPVVLSRTDTGDRTYHVETRDGYAYLACRRAGMVVVDARNPAEPRVAARVATRNFCQELAVHGACVYLADYGSGGIQVVDISDPEAPVVSGAMREGQPGISAEGMHVQGSCLYVVNGIEGLCIYDVSEPLRPRPIGNVSNRGLGENFPYDDVVSDGRAVYGTLVDLHLEHNTIDVSFKVDSWPIQCATTGPEVVVGIDVEPRDPSNRVPCGEHSGGIIEVALLGDTRFDVANVDMASVRFGPSAAEPIGRGRDRAAGRPRAVDGDGDRDLVLRFRSAETGIRCGDVSVTLTGVCRDGTRFAGQDAVHTRAREGTGGDDPVLSAAPNPFNPATTINFTTMQAGPASLAIYDVAGRLVRTLASEDLPVGPHTFAWDGRDNAGRGAASGIYMVRLRCADGAATLRMGLMK